MYIKCPCGQTIHRHESHIEHGGKVFCCPACVTEFDEQQGRKTSSADVSTVHRGYPSESGGQLLLDLVLLESK